MCFASTARVGCLSRVATCGLEEWLPVREWSERIPTALQNPAYRPPGEFFTRDQNGLLLVIGPCSSASGSANWSRAKGLALPPCVGSLDKTNHIGYMTCAFSPEGTWDREAGAASLLFGSCRETGSAVGAGIEPGPASPPCPFRRSPFFGYPVRADFRPGPIAQSPPPCHARLRS